jgi:hypothetical protein
MSSPSAWPFFRVTENRCLQVREKRWFCSVQGCRLDSVFTKGAAWKLQEQSKN